MQWKSPLTLSERNSSLEISLKNNTQVEKALCRQTFSLKVVDMTKRKWKVLSSPPRYCPFSGNYFVFCSPFSAAATQPPGPRRLSPTFLQLLDRKPGTQRELSCKTSYGNFSVKIHKRKRCYFSQRGLYIVRLVHIMLQDMSFKHIC